MLGNILSTGEQVLILVVLLAVGFLCGKIRIFNDQSISHLSAFALKIVGPCAIVESFCRQFDSAMLRAMVTYLLENGQITTTVTRAQEVAPLAEKMITLAKHSDLANYRQALSFITKEDVAKKLFDEIGPKYADRNGGYTRIIRTGPRRGDAAEMAIIELV